MSELSTAVCSITVTQRKRFFWAAWWTGAPHARPFRKPDASNGGALTAEAALKEAERVAGRHLTVIEPYWARAYSRVLRGEPAPPPPKARSERTELKPESDNRPSAWSVLGLSPGSSPDELKQAYRKRALETHPDQGGDAERFQQVQRAYDRLKSRIEVGSKRRR